MSSRKHCAAALAAIAAFALQPAQSRAQGFAETATATDIAQVHLAIGTDGENLPDGSGTTTAGKPLYDMHCAACHGLQGEGTLAQRLVGGIGSLDTGAPVKTIGSYWPTATTVFDYVRRAMPYTAPMSLTDDDYYAITAYLLYLNGLVDDGATVDKDSLPSIEMPNADGFVSAYPRVPPKYDYVR